MSEAVTPPGDSLSDDDLESKRQISRRSIIAGAAAAGAVIAAGAAVVLGASAAPAHATEQPDEVNGPGSTDLTDEDLDSPGSAPESVMSRDDFDVTILQDQHKMGDINSNDLPPVRDGTDIWVQADSKNSDNYSSSNEPYDPES